MEAFKLLVKFIYKNEEGIKRVKEEENIKNKIGKLLHKEGYKFVIAELEK